MQNAVLDGVSERKQNIFEIGEELEQIFDAYDRLTAEDGAEEFLAGALEKYFEDVADRLNDKIDAYCRLIKDREARAKVRKEYAAGVAELARTDENTAKRLKDRLFQFLKSTGNEKLDTMFHRVWLQKNGGKPPIEWTGGNQPEANDLIPEQFVRVTREIDVEAVRAALETGEEVWFAKLGDPGSHVRIK